MVDYNVHFDDTSRSGILDYFEHSQQGQQVAFAIASDFSSVTQAIRHTEPTGDGGSIVHLLTGDNVTFDNLPKPRLARIARAVGAYFGLQQ